VINNEKEEKCEVKFKEAAKQAPLPGERKKTRDGLGAALGWEQGESKRNDSFGQGRIGHEWGRGTGEISRRPYRWGKRRGTLSLIQAQIGLKPQKQVGYAQANRILSGKERKGTRKQTSGNRLSRVETKVGK